MWTLYDRLIAGTREDARIAQAHIGSHWVCLICDNGQAGIAMTMSEQADPQLAASFQGLTLKEAAQSIKSWDFDRAALGMAAINASYNTAQNAAHHQSLVSGSMTPEQDQDAFIAWQPQVRGKKVAVIGHFPYLETRFAPICDLKILERNPQPGDYPDPACEYILHEQDFVFMTGVTLINKTAPRLFQLSQNAHTIIVGPSVPMTDILFDFGVDAIAGFLPEDTGGCMQVAKEGGNLFEHGRMTRMFRPDQAARGTNEAK